MLSVSVPRSLVDTAVAKLDCHAMAGLTLEVKTMAGSLSRLPDVSLDMTVAEIKARKDWPLIGIPSKRQLVLFDGRMLDNFLTLAANQVRTEDGARVCLSVAVAQGEGRLSPQRLKYIQKYCDFSVGAKDQSQEDAQRRRQEKARLLQEQRQREAEERGKEATLQKARDCESPWLALRLSLSLSLPLSLHLSLCC